LLIASFSAFMSGCFFWHILAGLGMSGGGGF
jgi:hypothetical protein